MVTDRDLVAAAAATYSSAPTWSFFDGTVNALLTKTAAGLPVVAIEGTHNRPGWAGDFCAITVDESLIEPQHVPWPHPVLGRIHAGFYLFSRPLIPVVLAAIGDDPFALAGHSLGAALALLLGAELIIRGRRPQRIGAFAPPRVGMPDFVRTVTAVPVGAYRFGDDPVTEVPITLPGFPYAQVPLIAIGAPMPNPLDCHHIGNYASTVGA